MLTMLVQSVIRRLPNSLSHMEEFMEELLKVRE
jgi:hypothetical protein